MRSAPEYFCKELESAKNQDQACGVIKEIVDLSYDAKKDILFGIYENLQGYRTTLKTMTEMLEKEDVSYQANKQVANILRNQKKDVDHGAVPGPL